MQTGREQLRSQQKIMQLEGFYQGKLDGIWGPKTIAAKLKWERSGRFSPAIPNNGFPLSDRGPFPPGVFRNADGTLASVKEPAPAPASKNEKPPHDANTKQEDKPAEQAPQAAQPAHTNDKKR